MSKSAIHSSHAPAAIGTYSQAVRVGTTVYLSGQIGLDPTSMCLVDGADAQIERVLKNVKAVTEEAGGTLDDIVKITVYLTDLGNFSRFNEAMARHFAEPYPARAVIGVAALPRGACVEMDAIISLER